MDPNQGAASVEQRVRLQLEYWLSPRNLRTDHYLRRHLDAEGWVALEVLCGFKRMRALRPSLAEIIDAVEGSYQLELQRQLCAPLSVQTCRVRSTDPTFRRSGSSAAAAAEAPSPSPPPPLQTKLQPQPQPPRPQQRHHQPLDPDFRDRPVAIARDSSDVSGQEEFTVATWNVEADFMRPWRSSPGPQDPPRGQDRSTLGHCLRAVLDPREMVMANGSLTQRLSQRPNIVALQELQKCGRQVKVGNCSRCCLVEDVSRPRCRQEHAAWAEGVLHRHGYEGQHNPHRTNTLGLFFDPNVFENVTVVTGQDDADTMIFHTFHSGKVAVMAVLRHRATRRRLLVATVHLSVPGGFDHDDSTGQLEECCELADKIDDVWRVHGEVPVVLLGDFNALPTAVDGLVPPDVYNFLTRKCGLRSAYLQVAGCHPPYTSVKPTFRYCIDYIFMRGSLSATQVLDVHADQQDRNPWSPSDHVPLFATLRFEATAADVAPPVPSQAAAEVPPQAAAVEQSAEAMNGLWALLPTSTQLQLQLFWQALDREDLGVLTPDQPIGGLVGQQGWTCLQEEGFDPGHLGHITQLDFRDTILQRAFAMPARESAPAPSLIAWFTHELDKNVLNVLDRVTQRVLQMGL